MESCVKFPSSTPIEIVKLYRKLDLQRRNLEKKRTYFQGNLLKDTEQGNIFQTDDVEKGLADSLMEDLSQHIDVLMKEEKLNLKFVQNDAEIARSQK